jgi:multidrug efflux pump subunit AcrA (membrane-fusion protein)
MRFPVKAITFIIGCIGLLLLNGCGGSPTPAAGGKGRPAPMVSVAKAEIRDIKETVQLNGEVFAREKITIYPLVEGILECCDWREGERVKVGQKLFQIDREFYQSELNVAETALKLAEARLDDLLAGTRPEEIAIATSNVQQLTHSYGFKRKDQERMENLVTSGSAPVEQLDKANMEVGVEKAKLDAAEQQLRKLKTGPTQTLIAIQKALVEEAKSKKEATEQKLKRSIVYAPFSGTFSQVNARTGDNALSKVALAEMLADSPRLISLAVPERLAGTIQNGLPAEISFDALGNKKFSGKVINLFPKLDKNTRTRTIELESENASSLLPGMFARVNLQTAMAEKSLVVPLTAVLSRPNDKKAVLVISDSQTQQRMVKTGLNDGTHIQITDGLKPGEIVAFAGHERLKDGAKVRVAGAKSEKKQQNETGKKQGAK